MQSGWTRLGTARRPFTSPVALPRNVQTKALMDDYLLVGTGCVVLSTTLARLHARMQKTHSAPDQQTLGVLAYIPLLNSAGWLQRAIHAWRLKQTVQAMNAVAASAFYLAFLVAWLLQYHEDHTLVTACASSFLCLTTLQVDQGLAKGLSWLQQRHHRSRAWPHGPLLNEPPLQERDSEDCRQGALEDVITAEARQDSAVAERWDARYRLRAMTVAELRVLARDRGLRGRSALRKKELVALLEADMGLGSEFTDEGPG